MEKVAVFPGSFDPPTLGHIDLICRASKVFENLTVGVAKNPRKTTLFSPEERVSMFEEVMEKRGITNVKVEWFEGLLIHFLNEKKANIVIRGLRAISDFEYEFQMAVINRSLSPNVETFFLMSSERYIFLSSGMVKEIAMFGGDVSEYVPEAVNGHLKKRITEISGKHLGEAPTLKR